MKWLEDATEGNNAESNLLKLIKEISDRSIFNEVQLMNTEHYLMLNSQTNSQSGLLLNRKMGKLNISEVNNTLELIRLNWHGEGIYE
jgi:hypothetical protein